MPAATLADLLRAATDRLAACNDAPRREAEQLLAAAASLSRAALVADATRSVDAATAERFGHWIERRCRGEPLAYITGRRGFWTLDLEVTPDVLVPRPETELVVERALGHGAARTRLVDLGTGSGAIALALANERPLWSITAVDQSTAALAVAQRNAARLGIAGIDWRHGSWFAPLAGQRFDIIASNPPYIAADDAALGDAALRHEPQDALTPGADALAALRAIVAAAPHHLEDGGWIILEHGATQGPAVRALLEAQGFRHVVSVRDLSGHERVTEGRLPQQPAAAPHA